MEAQLRIVADTQDEAEAALGELREQFAGRLSILQAVNRDANGEWSAMALLVGQPDWVGYSQIKRVLSTVYSDPDLAMRDLDAQVNTEMQADDYVSMYGFDLVSALMRDARVVFDEIDERAELHLLKADATLRVWSDHEGWVLTYPSGNRDVQIQVGKGELIPALYKVMQILIEGEG